MEVFLGIMCGLFVFTWFLIAACCFRSAFLQRKQINQSHQQDVVDNSSTDTSKRRLGRIFTIEERCPPKIIGSEKEGISASGEHVYSKVDNIPEYDYISYIERRENRTITV